MKNSTLFLTSLLFLNATIASEFFGENQQNKSLLDLSFWQQQISKKFKKEKMDVLAVEKYDDNNIIVSLGIYNENSIDFATQEISINDNGEYNFKEINKNGCGYQFDLTNPTSPIIRIRKPSQEQDQKNQIIEEEEVGFVPFGNVKEARCQGGQASCLVVPFAQPVGQETFNKFKANLSVDVSKIRKGETKISIPTCALKPASAAVKAAFVRQNSSQLMRQSSSESCDPMASSTDTALGNEE